MASPSPLHAAAAWQQQSQAVQEQLQLQNHQQSQQIGELHHQLTSMQQELNSLRLHPAAVAANAPHGSVQPVAEHARTRNELLRAAKRPDSFRGEHGSYALNWLQEMDMFLENCEPPPSDSQKITLAKSFLRDEALHWWCAREKDVQRAAVSADAGLVLLSPAITTWEAFQCAVKDYFCPRGASDEARNEIHRLRQNQFRNLTAYADRFETVSRRIEVPLGQSIEAELIATFKAGLMNGLIRLSLTNTKPRTLFQAIQQAHQAESDLRVSGAQATSGRHETFRGSYGQNSHGRMHDHDRNRDRSGGSRQSSYGYHSSAPSAHSWSQSHSSRASGGAVPMDLSAMAAEHAGRNPNSEEESENEHGAPVHFEQESPSSTQLSAEDRSSQSTPESADEFTCSPCQLIAARHSMPPRCQKCGQRMQRPPRNPSECWNCGQPGHLSRDCPKPHAQRQAGPSSGNHRDAGGKPRHF